MFGFSSKNSSVIKKDFETSFEKLRVLSEEKYNSAVTLVNYEIKENRLSTANTGIDFFYQYYEERKNENDKVVENWKMIGIYEKKEAEVIATEILYFYTKALKYAKSDFETMKFITVRMAAISKMNYEDNDENFDLNTSEKIVIKCKKCSQSLRLKDITGWITCPKCNHKWLREKI